MSPAECKRCGGSGQIGRDRHSIWVCPDCYEYPSEKELAAAFPARSGVLAVMDSAAQLYADSEGWCGHNGDIIGAQEQAAEAEAMREARATVERLAEAAEDFLGDATLLSAEGKRLRAALAAFRGEA